MPAKISTKLSPFLFSCSLCCLLYFSAFSLIGQKYDFSKTISSQKQSNRFLDPNKIIDSLQMEGYLGASYYESQSDSSQSWYFQLGERFTWGALNFYLEEERVRLPIIIYKKGEAADRFALREELNNYLRKTAHNRGYPFAEAQLVIDSVTENQLYASVRIQNRNRIEYDTLEVITDKKVINPRYLQNYLNIGVGNLFSTKDYLSISNKIERLKFVQLAEPPLLGFSNNRSQIAVKLKKLPANQLDAFIGLVPADGKTNITGQVDIILQNLFKRAVKWQLNWQKYSANSQLLNTRLSQHAVFNTELGAEFDFSLLQEDSTFLQNSYGAAGFYPLGKSVQLGLGYKGHANNLIRDFSSEEIDSANEPFRSSQINAAVISVEWRQKDTYPVLKTDYYLHSTIEVGIKKVRNITGLPKEWQNVPEKSENFRVMLELGAQQKLWTRFLLEQNLQVAAVENQVLSRNDLLRLGGLQNLRGFDRNFFYTRHYGLLNLNYRYFLDNNSSFFLLTDFARLQNSLGWVYGLGAGLDIKSKKGWFRLIYAVGSSASEKINFSTAKVHFGYIAVF